MIYGQPGTNFNGQWNANVSISLTDDFGFASTAECIGNPNVVAEDANVYATGCQMTRKDILTGSNVYFNTGTKANPVWTLSGNTGAGVSSLNTLVGAVTLAAGTNITLGTVGNTITINSTGGGSMVYPGAGIPVSTGTAWSTSISGTSSQFVKADGSLDSSTYLTSISGQDLSTANNTTSAFTTLAAVAGVGYLTGNQSITLGGVLSGSGTTSITASYAAGIIHNLNALANASGVLTNDGSGNLSWASSGGTGTVTSVGLSSTNSTLTIGSTPVTTSGTITADLNLANSNTWTGQQTFNTSAPIIGTATISTIAGFDASKNLVSLSTATYPSLTELSYVKGVTSAIQTQLNAKLTSTLASGDIFVGSAGNVATAVAMSGDATLANTGAITLATVATGATTGGSTAIPVITFNNKGLVTGVSTAVVIAPAGTLSGTTLNSTVVSSSLTSVGTIATGLWHGTVIGNVYGGTGGDSSGGTGVAQLSSGTWSYSTALANGTTATTQASTDNSTKVATTAFVTTGIQNAINGLYWKPAVGYATTANVIGTNTAGVFTYTSTGVDTIDGHTLALNDQVLFKNQTTQADNGVWVVTTAGAIGVAGVLTRRSDYNTAADIQQGDAFYVLNGTVNANTTWVQTDVVTTINSDPLAFSQAAGPGTYTAGTGLTLTGGQFSVNVSQDITTLSNLTSNGLVTTSGGGGTLGITVPGTGVLTALGVNVGSAGAFVVNGGALGTPSSGTVTNLTGTASININGTVGATTPTTGAFTTIAASGGYTQTGTSANTFTGTPTFSNATYSALFTGGNVGIGTTTPGQKLDVAGNINVNTNGTAVLISSYKPTSTVGNNIFIGGGGQSSIYDGTNSYTGSYNTAVGLNALYSNTTGYQNTANGMNALYYNTTGFQNTANGMNALYSQHYKGNYNTANGLNALLSNTTGYQNTANGMQALYSNTTGYNNTANGVNALYSNTTGYQNTANGLNALLSNTTGYNNTANGMNAGHFIADGVTANQTSNNSVYEGYNAMAQAFW